MKGFLLAFLFLICAGISYSQSLKKYAIGNSGCSAYFVCNPGKFDEAKSPDSSEVYTGECTTDDVSYGIICVKLKEQIADMEASEGVLISYLDYLKTSLNIASAAGYGKGHRLKNKENTRGVVDYWKDKDDENWKIKGWTDGKFVCCMYVYSKKELNETRTNVFLDGLVLKGM
jgi:hypothetical protein